MTPSTPTGFPITPWSTIRVGDLIGHGCLGDTYKGVWQGKEIALKKFPFKQMGEQFAKDFTIEVKVVHECQSERVIRLFAVCMDAGQYALITEYMQKGSLFQFLHQDTSALPWDMRWRLAIEIAEGLSYLHSKEIIHCNLKSRNVLLDAQLHVKLSDFGFQKVKLESSSMAANVNSLAMTVRWQAPELFKRNTQHSKASDVYSLAMILWEIAARKIPFKDASNEIIVMGWIKDGELETIPQDCPSHYAQLIQSGWSPVPSSRPSIDDLLTKLQKGYQFLERTNESAKDAIRKAQPILDKTGAQIDQVIERAKILERSGKLGVAIKVLREALAIDRTHIGANLSLAKALQASGDLQGASYVYEKICELDPNNKEASFAYAEAEKLKKGSSSSRKSAAFSPPSIDVALLQKSDPIRNTGPQVVSRPIIAATPITPKKGSNFTEKEYQAVLQKVWPKVVVSKGSAPGTSSPAPYQPNPAYLREIKELEDSIPILIKNAQLYQKTHDEIRAKNAYDGRAHDYAYSVAQCAGQVSHAKNRIEEIHKLMETEGAARIEEWEKKSPVNKTLRFAAKDGNFQKLHQALCDGAGVNVKDENGKTALEFAAEGGSLECVVFLLENGATATLNTAYLAAKFGHLYSLKALIRWGATKAEANDPEERIIGLCYHERGEYQLALQKYNACIERHQKNSRAKKELALSLIARAKNYQSLDRTNEAAKDAREAAPLWPGLGLAEPILAEIGAQVDQVIARAKSLEQSGKLSDAIKTFKEALAIDQDHFNANLYLANALQANEDPAKLSSYRASKPFGEATKKLTAIFKNLSVADQNAAISEAVIKEDLNKILNFLIPGGADLNILAATCVQHGKTRCLEVVLPACMAGVSANSMMAICALIVRSENIDCFKLLFKCGIYSPDFGYINTKQLVELKNKEILRIACQFLSDKDVDMLFHYDIRMPNGNFSIFLIKECKRAPSSHTLLELLQHGRREELFEGLKLILNQNKEWSHEYSLIERLAEKYPFDCDLLSLYIQVACNPATCVNETSLWLKDSNRYSDCVRTVIKSGITTAFLETLYHNNISRNFEQEFIAAASYKRLDLLPVIIAKRKNGDAGEKKLKQVASRLKDYDVKAEPNYKHIVKFIEKWSDWEKKHPEDWRGLLDDIRSK